MAYKFQYQNNLYRESSGEEIDSIEVENGLCDIVKNSKYITMVGWRIDTGTYTIQSMLNDNKHVHVVEIFPGNCNALNASIYHENLMVHCINVKDFNDHIPLEERDVLIWQDGPEHLKMEESVEVINQIKQTYKSIIIATPKGLFEQGTMYGNTAEQHLSTWEIEDYQNIDFNVSIIGQNFLIGYWKK